MKSILVTAPPRSCSVCIFEKGYCDLYDDFKCIALRGNKLKVHNDFMTSRHPQCPLISINIKELEEAIEWISNKPCNIYHNDGRSYEKDIFKNAEPFNTIQDLITKLGGNKK